MLFYSNFPRTFALSSRNFLTGLWLVIVSQWQGFPLSSNQLPSYRGVPTPTFQQFQGLCPEFSVFTQITVGYGFTLVRFSVQNFVILQFSLKKVCRHKFLQKFSVQEWECDLCSDYGFHGHEYRTPISFPLLPLLCVSNSHLEEWAFKASEMSSCQTLFWVDQDS